jgi:hypothetical protein
MNSYMAQSQEALRASDMLETIDLERKRALIISAARAIHEMHGQLGALTTAENAPKPGNIVYDLAELATLLDHGVPDQVVALGLREAGTIMAKLCQLLRSHDMTA